MSLQDFINKWNGKGIDFDGYYGYQCMDLMHQYIVDCLGLPGSVLAAPTAYQAYVNGDPNFDKIDNTPEGVPQPGDIVFWNTSIGSAGHVAVFIDGDVNTFRSLDQNWPFNSVTHIQSHNYNGVAGWLHPKKGAQNMFTNPGNGDTRDAQGWFNAYAERNEQWHQDEAVVIPNLKSQIDVLTKQLDDQKAQVTTLTQQVTDLHTQVATQTGDTTQLNALGVALQWLIKRLGLK